MLTLPVCDRLILRLLFTTLKYACLFTVSLSLQSFEVCEGWSPVSGSDNGGKVEKKTFRLNKDRLSPAVTPAPPMPSSGIC